MERAEAEPLNRQRLHAQLGKIGPTPPKALNFLERRKNRGQFFEFDPLFSATNANDIKVLHMFKKAKMLRI